jgi:hypothetical protein
MTSVLNFSWDNPYSRKVDFSKYAREVVSGMRSEIETFCKEA